MQNAKRSLNFNYFILCLLLFIFSNDTEDYFDIIPRLIARRGARVGERRSRDGRAHRRSWGSQPPNVGGIDTSRWSSAAVPDDEDDDESGGVNVEAAKCEIGVIEDGGSTSSLLSITITITSRDDESGGGGGGGNSRELEPWRRSPYSR